MWILIKLFLFGYKCPSCGDRSHLKETILSPIHTEPRMVCNWCRYIGKKEEFKGKE